MTEPLCTENQIILNGQRQSEQQVAFYEELEKGTSSIILEAVAGSGKTTTIVNGARNYVPKHSATIFLAFNKRIVEELKPRLPANVSCATTHSVGLGALTRSLPKRPKVNFDKTRDLLKANLKWKDIELYAAFATRLIGFAKNAGVAIAGLAEDSEVVWDSLVSYNSLTLESRDADPARGIEIARAAFDESIADYSVVDGDDMLYMAVARRCRFDVSNFIFLDEAQDTNAVQRALLRLMGRFDDSGISRLIAVGDPMQAIYGFRGADSDALDLIRSDFAAKTMPLSTCYRCSQAVIAEVWKNFPQLKPQ